MVWWWCWIWCCRRVVDVVCDWFSMIRDSLTLFKSVEICMTLFESLMVPKSVEICRFLYLVNLYGMEAEECLSKNEIRMDLY
ncbi:hypothetical protein A2U01_0021567 [Trifolium medium]|uniref:Uncharacterized protein n=1 Tax=Trifolium medium TaxID=97028 RepID=A0A392NKY4_9FABA|nr:hypothetical protein [Trifolium medium]